MKMSLRRSSATESRKANGQVTQTPHRSRLWLIAAVLVAGVLSSQVSGAQNTGINFPPNQGTSGGGAFLPGIYTYTYTNAQIAAANSTFNMMRIPVNEATANDPASLQKIKGYVDQFAGHYAIICMFGVAQTGKTHGDGFPDGLAAMGSAWANINTVFASYPNVHYEIFNEPFGYPWSTLAEKQHYVSDMETIITDAGMSINNPKIILDGMGYAQKVDEVVEGGWTGDIAYHFYPNWINPENQAPSQSNFSNLVQGALGTYGQRVWVTEFGANLSEPNPCYDTYDGGTSSADQNINALRGLDDALRALRANGHGVKGAFAWHGWDNGDSYDFWLSSNSNGACKIHEIETHD
jgi:hypothetical protein